MTPKFASWLEVPPQPPETTWGLDGVEIRPGRGARVWVGANTLITQGGRRIPLHEIVERAGAQRLSGSSEDVPDALKRLAAKTRETR